nr:immunoglobulin heavy chain junction region [Macaca mulatta]MOX00229.1 immunoglobulin heavy chain junction region [Macaca mulatta]MOX01586.1 immunoglobulin heavy chain junction region [Macaca mulatta]MOX02498.1 immunoglobulin heavy chain junction region [Macaca mulatta]MOX02987.1 immunoglobulin heavy chain junction region [Macaca mulatta]
CARRGREYSDHYTSLDVW